MRYFAELRQLAHLALPLVLAQFAQMAMGFVDTVMAGRVSPVDLAAVAIGGSVWFPILLFITGVLMAVSPVVAHHFGAGDYKEIPAVVRQGIWIALGLGLAGLLLLRNMEWLLAWLGLEPEVQRLAAGYLRAIAWGLPAMAIFQALRCFSEGVSRTRPIMLIGFLGLACNIPANYILIYGKLGFPALGGVGCGWASALVMWVMMLALAALIRYSGGYRFLPSAPRRLRPDWPALGRLARLGFPIGIAMFIETSVFAVIALLVGSLGAVVVAGHQVALNFTSLLFMVPLSISMAITVRVGQAVGRGEPAAARFSALCGTTLTMLVAVVFAGAILLLAPAIAAIYTPDPEVRRVAAGLLFFAALFQISDAAQISATGALRGYKDTRVPMLITFFAFWFIGLPTGYLLGLGDWPGLHLGATGFWIGLVAGLSTAAILHGMRLWRIAGHHFKLGATHP
ncbi:MAG: MATE family efflux transporter [Desulfurivibrio sp.]|nr:MATE family efflux transporter [Desulfurivibrio sp.]